ncbi:hypothetical protein C3747_99g172 [Trypanosoma cruzi]|uniref:Uncharacterized protein n=2 Tax=Trypanosoma cruzi TaxID=5693 RepID=Q4DLN3_TRYCC|nr:hypothetical protein, conserved [Trypanosoma cruzi]EAN93441.1 hypothetical protein, conserved [Trypanosoma cruzi]PWV07631.1 hypothetical protein C3747_99g172 [Trypanosoma cruzi]RNC54610.1 hypothetical protein TcCL_ESM07957 [Trypanosoma cruzi]|eukprot:XP_815292.1 hypothetical protein [Trypanosoma cruzi strain CL Brener]
MQSLAHTAYFSSPLGNSEWRGLNAPSLVERHLNSHVESRRSLYQREAPTTAWASASSSSSSSSGAVDGTVGSFALRRCLDLLVRAQRTQSESVTMLTTLRERLFPTPRRGGGPLHTPVVALDDVDREVLRLRILELKHSGLNPKLSESIDSALLPFQSCLRQESGRSAAASETGGVSEALWEPCNRVASLREQFMGLAQLQEEAMQSLGMQLSELFAATAAKSGSLYYYPAVIETNDGDGTHGTRERGPHDAVLRFLEQLEDVMASKQHIVLCLAMVLREIYDSVAPTSALSLGVLPVATSRGKGEALCVFKREDSANTRVSVSVSPLSTLHPSCSAPREESVRSPTGETDGRTLLQPIHAGHVQECRSGNSNGPPDVDGSPLPKLFGCDMSPNEPTCRDCRGRREKMEESPPHQEDSASSSGLRPSWDCDISPESGNPRSPSLCTGGMRAVSASPPPPLARCLGKQTEETLQASLDANCWLRQKNEKGEGESIAEEMPQPQSAPNFLPSMSEGENRDHAPVHERRQKEPTVDIAAENARLVRLLEAKDSMILGMQERFLGAVPLLVERLGSNGPHSVRSGSNNSNCSCRSRYSLTRGDSAEERSSTPPPPTRTVSTSTCQRGSGGRIEEAAITGRSDEFTELTVLKERLAAHMEENKRLRDALNEMKEEKQRWKREARELKEENHVWKERGREAKMRCERLEDDILFLKKRLLKSEGALMLRDAAFTSVKRDERPLLSTSSSHHLSGNAKSEKTNRETDGLVSRDEADDSLSPTRSRSRTLSPSLKVGVTTLQTSASLQEKRNRLLSKLGKRTEEGTLPQANPSFDAHEDPIVVVSPLTEERVMVGGGGAAPTTPPPSAISFSSSSGAVRIDRRLSPEYHSPQAEPFACVRSGVRGDGAGNARLSTAEVDRILASARSLLKSVGSARNGHRDLFFPSATDKMTFASTSDSSWSDCASTISGENVRQGSGAAASYAVASADEEEPLPPRRCSISPCSSVSYSSAKKRAQRLPPRQLEQSETNIVSTNQRKKNASLSSPSLSPAARQSRQKNVKGKSTPSPGAQRSAKPRPPTAREALMRELRDQLDLLQTHHASVLNQEEQLQLKRKQVVAAIQRHSDGENGSSSTSAGKKRLALTALLKRFDATQERVQKKEARLREYVEIVRRQLKTLEDDLL